MVYMPKKVDNKRYSEVIALKKLFFSALKYAFKTPNKCMGKYARKIHLIFILKTLLIL